jgi:hypothetical protein
MTEPFLLAWGGALTAAILTAGCGLIILFVVVVRSYMPPSSEARLTFIGLSIAGVVMTVGAVMLLVARRKFCRLTRWAQWVVTALVMLVMVLCMTAAVIWVR